MKNEERIIKLFVEIRQRIDRHHEESERLNRKFDQHSEQFKLHNEQFERHNEQFERHSEQIERQQEEIWALIGQIQNHQERLDKHGEGIGALCRERTEAMHQSSLEQVKAYQAITELVMHHNRALIAKGIL